MTSPMKGSAPMNASYESLEFGLDTFGDLPEDADGNRLSYAAAIRQVVDEAVLADRLGVDVIAVGEHHRPEFAISSPDTVLAGIATRTERIKLASGVTVLSSDDPVRVFQRFATIDALSNGRAQVILGRGSFTESFPLFGYDLRDYDVLFEEKIELFVKLLEEDHDAMVKVLRRWSRSEDLWLRRAAIIAQVLRHEATELELLFEFIEPAMHEKEFFLRKAIGWALRAAGKEFPREIRAFVDANATRLSGLSKREAEKSLSRGERVPRSGG